MSEPNKTPPPKPVGPPVRSMGDCVLTFTADTTGIDKAVTETIERLERAIAAFKAEWNRK